MSTGTAAVASAISPHAVPSPGHETPAERAARDKLWKYLDKETMEGLSKHFEDVFGISIQRTPKGCVSRVQPAEGRVFFQLALTFLPVLTPTNDMDARARSYQRVFKPIFEQLPRAYQMLFPRCAKTGRLVPNRLGLLPLHVKTFKEAQAKSSFAVANPLDRVYHAFQGDIPGLDPLDVLAMNTLLRTYGHLRWHRERRADENHLRHIVTQWRVFHTKLRTAPGAAGRLQEYQPVSSVQRVLVQGNEQDGDGDAADAEGELVLAEREHIDLSADDEYDDGFNLFDPTSDCEGT